MLRQRPLPHTDTNLTTDHRPGDLVRIGPRLVLVVSRTRNGSALACPICVQRAPLRRDQLRLDSAAAVLMGLCTHRRAWIVDAVSQPAVVSPDAVSAGRVPFGILELVHDRARRAAAAEAWEIAA